MRTPDQEDAIPILREMRDLQKELVTFAIAQYFRTPAGAG